MRTFRFIEGFMPLQFLLELVGIVLLFTGVAALLERVSCPINRFFKAVLVFVTFVLYLTYRVYPPMPFSILATYITVGLLAVLLWASSSDAYWQEFKQPILAVVDAETLHTRVLRSVLVILIPCLAGWVTWHSMLTKIEEPVELRTVIPAPPNTFTAFGKRFVTHEVQNPFRVNEHGKYDQRFTDALSVEEGGAGLMKPSANPWASNATAYLMSVREGGALYFQNCAFCHGANLSGRGHENFAFNPYATNFVQLRTILYVEEGHEFWRTAGGGTVLPTEGFPWASVMPPMEEHLTADEIWKILLFKSWFTGGDPAWVYEWR